MMGMADMPEVFLQNVARDEEQAGNGREDEKQGKPGGVGEEDSGQGQKTQSILHDGTEVFQQREWLSNGVDLGAIEEVVRIRVVVERQIETEGLRVNEAMNLVLHFFGLYGPDPRKRARQQLSRNPQRGNAHYRRCDRSPTWRCDEPVNQGAQQQCRACGDQSLADEQDGPGRSPSTCRFQDEGKSAAARGQLTKELGDLAF